MAEVTKQDIEETVFAADFDFDQFVSLITKHVEIQIPNELNNPNKKKELIDYVFNAIQKQDQEDELKDEDEPQEEERMMMDHNSKGNDEPEIKIDLNLGSEESTEEPDVEDGAEAVIPLQGVKNSSEIRDEFDGLGEITPSMPAAASPSSTIDFNASAPTSHSASTPPFANRKSHIIALVRESKWTVRHRLKVIE